MQKNLLSHIAQTEMPIVQMMVESLTKRDRILTSTILLHQNFFRHSDSVGFRCCTQRAVEHATEPNDQTDNAFLVERDTILGFDIVTGDYAEESGIAAAIYWFGLKKIIAV